MRLNVELLEKNFMVLAPQGDRLVEEFYRHLFANYPELEPMFHNVNMGRQRKMFLASLQLIVNNLGDPDVLVPVLERLGARHAAYGVRKEHFPLFKHSFLCTLAEVSGDRWHAELAKAWSDAYDHVIKHMLAGMMAPVS